MAPAQDTIVPISPQREKFFGCSGKMLIPGVDTVAAAIQCVPKHKLITTDLLRQRLAQQFNVEVTCPSTTRIALKTIGARGDPHVPYWRVVKKNGELLAAFPGGVKGQAALLRQEGFVIATKGTKLQVKNLETSLVK